MWGYVKNGALMINTHHSLFKISNPAADKDGPGDHGNVFGYCSNREEDDEHQLFKPTQDNCHNWKKAKVPDDKGAFTAFYAEKKNKNKWWTPAAVPDHPLVETHMPLTIMLTGALGHLVGGGLRFENIGSEKK